MGKRVFWQVVFAPKPACRILIFTAMLISVAWLWSSVSPAEAADSRCPIVVLAPLSGEAPVLGVARELPDNQVAFADKTAGSRGRDALAEDFEEAKLAPFWDQKKWLEAQSFALTSAGVKAAIVPFS
jgi:hypothetical protein